MSTGDTPLAEYIPCNNFWAGGDGNDYIVIHATASGGVQTAYQLVTSDLFTKGNDPNYTGRLASVHYVIGRGPNDDGKIYQCVLEQDSAWGNCCTDGNSPFLVAKPNYNWNRNTISIENVKYSNDNQEALTPKQYQSLLALVRDIAARQNIPLVQGTPTQRGIIFHHDLMPVEKARCPGTFPYTTFFADLKGESTPLAVLQNFPVLSQRTPITADKQPNEDAEYACVAASIGCCLQYYRGKTNWDDEVDPDVLKDEAYGQGYVGGTAASRYVAACKKRGFRLYEKTGTPTELVAEIHRQLQAGHPVVFTIPSIYDPTHTWSHVCAAFGEIAGPGFEAVDPYPLPSGVVTRKSDAEWKTLLMFNSIWIVEKEAMMINITDAAVTPWFTLVNGDQWQCKVANHNYILMGGILGYYRRISTGSDQCGITVLGMPNSGEIKLNDPKDPGAVKQEFERGTIFYNPAKSLDNPPGAGTVYHAHIDSLKSPGLPQAIASAITQRDKSIADLAAKIADLQAQIDSASAVIPQTVRDDITMLASHVTPAATLLEKLVQDAGLGKIG